MIGWLGGPRRGEDNTLIVVCHPRPQSLVREAARRAEIAARAAGRPVRVLDLDELDFDPVLTGAEVEAHLGSPDDRPYLADHLDALRWANRLILVYPTWFSGQPARLKGWFDRVWMNEVAFELPPGADRIRGRLDNLVELQVITTHGSTRRVNFVQGNSGRIRVFRTLRVLCNRRCRTTWTAIYDLDNAGRPAVEQWLDGIERRVGGGASGPGWRALLR